MSDSRGSWIKDNGRAQHIASVDTADPEDEGRRLLVEEVEVGQM